MDDIQGVLKGQKIAYFSTEIGLRSEISTYSQYFTNWIRKSSIPITISNI